MNTLAIKIHYDNRPNLTNSLKYSMPPKAEDYAEFFNAGVRYVVYDIICRSNKLFFKESKNEQIEVLYEQSIRIG